MDEATADLQAGIAATRAGDKEQARACFIRALKHEPANETAWLWLSHVMPTVEQALRCIDHLLTINPHNRQAQEARDVLNIRLLLEEAAMLRPQAPTPPPSTPQRRYMLGEALVEARILTQQQLEQALKEQQRLARKKKVLRLGEVLLRMKLVRPEQLEAAIATQIETLPTTEGATMYLGEYLVRRGLVTRAQLHQGLAQQNELKRKGRAVLLGDVLVRCGYLAREQLNHAIVEWQQHYNMSFNQ
jgi:tetratricopeptide (TPR) repeat protein